MPIVKCEASKATPMKGLTYIMNPDKTLIAGSIGLRSEDPKRMAEQMMQTMHVHGKGWDPDERKYYHCKVSFDPKDLPENGGDLTPKKADNFAREYAEKTWPGREVAWSIQHHGTAMHIHFIVGACEMATGKKLDARQSEYRKWKNYAQDLARAHGLSDLDWEKATREKRQREIQPAEPVSGDTLAEQGLKAKGERTWKDELRSCIDAAAKNSRSMEEFKAVLQENGVELTRCTAKTISYRLAGRDRACRGDTLGGDYTSEAVRSALEHNNKAATEFPVAGGKRSLDAIIGAAGGESGKDRKISKEEREVYREFGRLAGVKRSEVDELCAGRNEASWQEKQAVWADYRKAKAEFWDAYNAKINSLREQIDGAYKRREMVKAAEWALDPRNRRKSLFGSLYAAIVLARSDPRRLIEQEIEKLRETQRQLRWQKEAFKNSAETAKEDLLQKGLSLDEYMASVERMQFFAEQIYDGSSGSGRGPGKETGDRW